MKWLQRLGFGAALAFAAIVIGLNVWGLATLGTLTPDPDAVRDDNANRVVLVSGATGSVGDALLKTAIDDPHVETVHVITRRSSPRIDQGVASGKVQMHLLEDFTDYSSLADVLPQVNTVLWALGTSSL